MPNRTLSLLLIMCMLVGFAAQAQEQETEKVFKLLRPSSSAIEELDLEEESRVDLWEPTIKPGQLEVSFTLGNLNLDQVLLAHNEIIYKYTDEDTYWGDVAFKGSASAFSPSLRMNYNISHYFGLEGLGNFSTCNYSTNITNRVVRSNGDAPVVSNQEPVLEEFDGERRSLVAFLGSINAVIYPLNIREDRVGNWHPYITRSLDRLVQHELGLHRRHHERRQPRFGAGIRFLAEKVVSARFEVVFLQHELEWKPAEYFKSLNDGTKIIDLNEYSDGPTDPKIVTSYEPQSISTTQISLGFRRLPSDRLRDF